MHVKKNKTRMLVVAASHAVTNQRHGRSLFFLGLGANIPLPFHPSPPLTSPPLALEVGSSPPFSPSYVSRYIVSVIMLIPF